MNTTQLNKTLDKYQLRKTPGMQKILKVFIDTKVPLTAEQIYKKVQKHVNQSTVYRTIKRFTDKKLINIVHLSSDKQYYELADRHHHHHLVCTSCETIVDIPCIDDVIKKIKPKKFNFTSIESHSFELFGICNKCK